MEPTIEFKSGANIDYRSEDEKKSDWRPQEAFAHGAVEWKEKTVDEIEAEIKATSISQGATMRCVSEYAGIFFEVAELCETGEKKVFSRRDTYCRRVNRPFPGMSMLDLFKIMKVGTCLESQLPSTQTKENEINLPYNVTDEMKDARAKYAADSYFIYDKFSIDDIASMIDSGIPVCLFWYFDLSSNAEWWNKRPKVVNGDLWLLAEDTGRHQATGMVFHLKDGKKTITVMDSAGQGTGYGKQRNLRDVDEAFLKERCYGAGFAIDKKNLDFKPEEIHYHFNRNLQNGDDGEDVKILQKILILENCLVLKDPTIYFRGMTQAGVKKLQEKYADQILKPLGLKKGTGIFWESTRKFINEKYK